MSVIGIDVDDTIADLISAWRFRINKAYGLNVTTEDWISYDPWPYIGITKQQAFAQLSADIYRDVIPLAGALEAVERLRHAGNTIVYVTTCHDSATELAKQSWLLKWRFLRIGEGIKSGHMLPAHDKSTAPVDVLVDDHILHVEHFPREAVLITRPHNKNSVTTRPRVNSLLEFAGLRVPAGKALVGS